MSEFKQGDFVRPPARQQRVLYANSDMAFVQDDSGIVMVAPDGTELLWRPKYRPGEYVWHTQKLMRGTVTEGSESYVDGQGYYIVTFGGQNHNVTESNLVPYTGQDEEVPMDFTYSYHAIKQGQRTPRGMLYQLAANKLSEITGDEDMRAGTVDAEPGVDGTTGPMFTASAKAVQKHFGITEDAVVGKGTWTHMTGALGTWRPPLRIRISEQQNTFENGARSNAFGAWNVVSFEGWPNYGIWNANCMDGNMAGSSIGIMLSMAGRRDLWSYDPDQPQVIADFLASASGRKVQLYDYMDKYIIQPAIDNLGIIAFEFPVQTASELPDTLGAFWERLLALACDMSVNSGPVGMFGSLFPRVWDGDGVLAWDDVLPDQDACINIYEEVYGITVTSKTQQYVSEQFSRDKSREAMRRCMTEVCTTNEQRINLLADLQGRCISARDISGPETLQELVIRRRRCVGRLGGYQFQGAHFDSQARFGIGV